jgi:hypothetical protein
MLAAFALVALVGVDRVCTFPFVGSDRLNHSHPWIESGSVARHRMVRFLIMFACRPAGRPSSTRYSRDPRERITHHNADPGRRTELLVPTKRAALTLISHSIGGDAIVVVICLVDMRRVTI